MSCNGSRKFVDRFLFYGRRACNLTPLIALSPLLKDVTQYKFHVFRAVRT